MNAARFFKCLSDETRLRCLMLLQTRKAVCVCHIADALAAPQPRVSRHLAQLRACELVADHREGQWVHYRIHPGLADWQIEVLERSGKALKGQAPFCEDLTRLAKAEQGTGPRCS